jgi:hypothetical protein
MLPITLKHFHAVIALKPITETVCLGMELYKAEFVNQPVQRVVLMPSVVITNILAGFMTGFVVVSVIFVISFQIVTLSRRQGFAGHSMARLRQCVADLLKVRFNAPTKVI